MGLESCQKRQLRVHVRWMIRRDMPEILQIEQASFNYPWMKKDFLRRWRQRNCIVEVAEVCDRTPGFMVYELHKTELRVLNFAVSQTFRRLGIGSQMIAKLTSRLSIHRRTKITLMVRESNLSAQLFFRTQGFKATKILRNYYEDSGDDAYHMQFRVNDGLPEEFGEGVNRIAQYY